MTDDFAPPPPSGEPVQPTEPDPSVPSPQTEADAIQDPVDVSAIKEDDAPTESIVTSEVLDTTEAPAPPTGAPVDPQAQTPVQLGTQPPSSSATETPTPAMQAPPPPPAQTAPTAAMPVAPPPPGYQAAPGVAPQMGGSAAAPVKKKANKKIIIAIVAVVAAIIIIVAGVLIFQEVTRSSAYDQASTYFDNGEYAQAEDAFWELGDYRDSAERYLIAGDYKVYEEGKALYDEGSYLEARDKFTSLYSSSISDIDEWVNKCDYALADELYTEGDLEGARDGFEELGSYSDSAERANAIRYELADKLLADGMLEEAYDAFRALGDYTDSAARAAAIPQAFPESGVLWQAEGSYYEQAAIEIDYKYSSGAAYYKIYSGETLIATLFCNANSTVRVYLNPGTYTIKEGTGDTWFGEAYAFGKNGYYSTMTYDDTGTDWFELNNGDLVTITINAGISGNVSERDEDLSTF